MYVYTYTFVYYTNFLPTKRYYLVITPRSRKADSLSVVVVMYTPLRSVLSLVINLSKA